MTSTTSAPKPLPAQPPVDVNDVVDDDLEPAPGGVKRWLKKLGLYHAALLLVGGTAALTYYALRTAFGIGPISVGPKLLTPDSWLTSVPIASLINVCVVLAAVGLVRKANRL